MAEKNNTSNVEITVGDCNIEINGSEEFISNQLTTILDRVDLSGHVEQPGVEKKDSKSKTDTPKESETLAFDSEESEEKQHTSAEAKVAKPGLSKFADRANVDASKLEEHFYIDEEEIHVQDPLQIEAKYAVLGYCSIREVLDEDPYHDNTETKKKMIDVEKVNIDSWGRKLLPNLRSAGLIKDDPNTEMSRNKPFKVTPKGRKEFVEWLNEDN